MTTKFNLSIVFTCLLVLMSCSSDDDDGAPMEVTPEGTWKLVSLHIETAFDFNGDGISDTNLYDETPCYDNDFVQLNADGSARVVTALTDISPEVTAPDDYTYVYTCLDGFDVETNWTQNDKTISVSYGSFDFVGNIVGNQLKVKLPDFFEIEFYNGVEYYTVKEDAHLVYVKE
ncbi:hypothetical protein OS188_07555 [Xanthomarina sp. F1114]|uniref:hypothetical protein n=1 Tax=unclassified Xanthomarina TaxID=2649071 RepID=UPI00225E61AD|nr:MULTISPECIES: hypothetical protein [unclassified Xanthomarina]MCX7547804.1 hypothetical protein [Xanthomarina sp. F1114]MCX7549952.1 hypothetical protein [Xanthomarina sp. F2636L]